MRDLGEFHEIQLSTPYLDRDDYVAAVEEFASLGALQAQIDRMIDWVDRPDGGIFGFNGEALIPQPVGYDLHLTGFLEGGHLSLEYSVVWPSEVGRDR